MQLSNFKIFEIKCSRSFEIMIFFLNQILLKSTSKVLELSKTNVM